MAELIAAGIVSFLCDAAAECEIDRAALLAAAGLCPRDLGDPAALVPLAAFEAALRHLLARSGDRAIGLRLARAMDLRTQGFWGYALIASTTLRERLDVHLRYTQIRFPCQLSLAIEGDRAVLTCVAHGVAPELAPTLFDWAFAVSCLQQRSHFGDDAQLELWLTYPEEPHHAALRALVGGHVEFGARVNCLRFPARQLDQPLAGSDPHLGALARSQLDAQLARRALIASPPTRTDSAPVLDEVRARLSARLASDPTIECVARDLGVSARTLRRRLGALGASFQDMLLELRRTRAIAFLLETDQAIDGVGAQLGYGDPANFRRAFRRWTGLAPSAFRALHRGASRPHL
jgi:AraC-like DNA-binding protein